MHTWLITGIASKIGQQLAELLLKRGDRVAATVRKRDRVQYLIDKYDDQLQVTELSFPGLSIYHASKWAVEGFLEAVIKEVASFGIQVTMVEPGGIQTNFSGPSMDAGTPNPVYDQTPVGQMRQYLGGSGGSGNPKKVAQAIADSAALTHAPKRLVLGSDAYAMLHAELTARLDNIDSQKDSAPKTDA